MALLDAICGITTPTLVIAGAMDVSTPFLGHGDKIAAAIGQASVVQLDTAHLPPIEDPAGFARVIAQFARRL